MSRFRINFWLFVILFSLGITLIIEGIVLNIIAMTANDASYLLEGTILIFLGSASLSTSLYPFLSATKPSKNNPINPS